MYEPIVVLAVLQIHTSQMDKYIYVARDKDICRSGQISFSRNTGEDLRDMMESSPRLLDRLLSSRPLCCGASVSYKRQM